LPIEQAIGQTNLRMQAKLIVLACVCLGLALPSNGLAERVKIQLTSLTTIEDTHLEPHVTSHPAKGDFIDFRDLLYNRGRAQFGKAAGKAVAWDEGLVFYTGAKTRTIKVLLTFPELGTLLYQGPLTDGPVTIPIVRGTGAFKGAKGTITIGPGANTVSNTIDVTVPGNPIDITSGSPAA
jgi:hypothetical protein